MCKPVSDLDAVYIDLLYVNQIGIENVKIQILNLKKKHKYYSCVRITNQLKEIIHMTQVIQITYIHHTMLIKIS